MIQIEYDRFIWCWVQFIWWKLFRIYNNARRLPRSFRVQCIPCSLVEWRIKWWLDCPISSFEKSLFSNLFFNKMAKCKAQRRALSQKRHLYSSRQGWERLWGNWKRQKKRCWEKKMIEKKEKKWDEVKNVPRRSHNSLLKVSNDINCLENGNVLCWLPTFSPLILSTI